MLALAARTDWGCEVSYAERTFMLWTLSYLAVYIVVFFSLGAVHLSFYELRGLRAEWIMPFHLLGMFQNFVAFVLTIRDLYLRPFPNPNAKLTWALLIHWTGGIGWLVYVFKHALKPRPPAFAVTGPHLAIDSTLSTGTR